MKTSSPSTLVLTSGAKLRFIQRLAIHCFECSEILPMVPVNDYLVCSLCYTKHDLRAFRPAPQVHTVNRVVMRPDGSRYSRKVLTNGQLDLLELPF